jgi:hypothetical protein
MSKRTREINDPIKKHKKKRLKLEDAPPVNSIKDLIEISNTIKFYKNLNTLMLWRVTPYLEELNKLIGMNSLKESVFMQVIYYMKGMHLRNKEGEFLHTIIMGVPGVGKCLSINTPLIMYDGKPKMVQDVKEGDLLMGDDSTPRKVLSTCTGKETMYEIQQLYGDNYIVNKSHILSLKLSKGPHVQYLPNHWMYMVCWFEKDARHCKVFKYNNDEDDEDESDVRMRVEKFKNKLPPKGTVIDISIDEYLSRNKDWKSAYKGYKVGIDFPKKDVEFNPYMLGLWLGDGDSNGNILTTNDVEIVEYLNSYSKIVDDRFLEYLSHYNLIKNKHIPDEYKYTDRETRLEVLAGLLDSDGHLNNNGVDIIKKHKNLLEDIVWLARSLGFRAEMKECQKSCMYKGTKKTGSYFRTYIYCNTCEIPCKIKRYQTGMQKQIKDPLMYGIELREMPENDYYGFTLDGNHRYLLGDFTVTHNTSVAKIIGKIYQTMGILSSTSVFKIAHRDDFIAEYLGQTAIKTKRLLESCIGGVLFIDEVYSLAPRNKDRDSFSKEALDTLTAFLSEHKNDFCCIAAGYEDDINRCFFNGNNGLESRFQWVHKIEAYSPEELTNIFIKMVGDMKWKLDVDVSDVLSIIKENKKYFEYAGRDIETFLTKCKMVHTKRIFSLGYEHMFIFTLKDLKEGIKLVKKHKTKKEDCPPEHMYI